MATWSEVTRAAPELVAAVQRRFDAYIHKTLATLRADGSPRISGIEASFRDGEMWLAALNALGSVALGLVAVWLGVRLAQSF